MTAPRREQGRARSAQRPFDLFPYPRAACQSGITEIIDGDAVKVSRVTAQCKPAVALSPGDGHAHLHR